MFDLSTIFFSLLVLTNFLKRVIINTVKQPERSFFNMIKTKYIDREQAQTIYKVIVKGLETTDFVKVYDTESFVIKSNNPDEILNAIDGGDEETGLNFYKDKKCVGWVGVLPYEEPDSVIFDHSDNEFCHSITAGI